MLELFTAAFASQDDAEEHLSNGAVTVDSGDLDLGNDNGQDQVIGLRFDQIGIPKGATITGAYLQFTADESDTAEASFVIRGEAVEDAASYLENAFNISSRSVTQSSAQWSPGSWSSGDSTDSQTTPDLSHILQEIIDQQGWTEDNAISFVISGTGSRVAESLDGNKSKAAPVLHVEWSMENGNSDSPSETSQVSIPPETNSSSYVAAGDFALNPGEVETGKYGNKFDGASDPDGIITATFEGTGSNLVLSFDGYDIDTGAEVEVVLNGQSLGLLSAGVNKGLEAYEFQIAAGNQLAGTNTIEFVKLGKAKNAWGVTNVLIRDGQDSGQNGQTGGVPDLSSGSDGNTPPEINLPFLIDFFLSLGVMEEGIFGNGHEGAVDEDGVVTATFEGTGNDLLLSFNGYDIDHGSEVEIRLNGHSLGFLSAGISDGFFSYVLQIAAEFQLIGMNKLEIVQIQNPSDTWGVTDILISNYQDSPAGGPVADDGQTGFPSQFGGSAGYMAFDAAAGSTSNFEHTNASKSFFHDGTWWSILPEQTSGQSAWSIYEFSEALPAAGTVGGWETASLPLFGSNYQADVAFDAASGLLYVLMFSSTDPAPKLLQLSYSQQSRTWLLEATVELASELNPSIFGSNEDIGLGLDQYGNPLISAISSGINQGLYLAYSETSDLENWKSVTLDPDTSGNGGGNGNSKADFVFFTYNGEEQVGLFYSQDGASDGWRLVWHQADDGQDAYSGGWLNELVTDSISIDDHISAIAHDGKIYASVKDASDNLWLLAGSPGNWQEPIKLDKGGSRPVTILDETQNRIYVAYQESTSNGDVILRSASLDDLVFDQPRSIISGGDVKNPQVTSHVVGEETDNYFLIVARDGDDVWWNGVSLDDPDLLA